MCEELVEECGDPRLVYYLPGYCAAFGQAGLDDPRNEDQCFAVYGDCIDDCRYFRFLLETGVIGPDASTASDDSDSASDDSGGLPDADEGGLPIPDAAVSDSAADSGG